MEAYQIDRVTINHDTGTARVTHIDPNGVEHTITMSKESLEDIYRKSNT